MRHWAQVVVALLFCMSAAARAEELPDSQTLRDRSAAAYGPKPQAYHEIITFRGTAASGRRETFVRGADYREIDDSGPIHTEFGLNAGQRWHENENGHVVIDQADPGFATHETYTTTVTRVSSPVDAYVITRLNAKASGTREYIDPKTYFVVRRENLGPTGKVITTYDEFTTFGTRHLAGHWATHNETTATDTDYTLSAYDVEPVSDDAVAIPSIKHPLVQYPPGVDHVVLPTVFEPSGHVIVRVTIAGRGYDFVLDTGASGITLDTGTAHQFGLTPIQTMQSSVDAGRYTTGYVVVPEMRIGGVVMQNIVTRIAPQSMEEPGVRSVGLMGFDFLCESGITIDYEHQRVTADRYGTYAAPTGPRVVALPIRLGTQQPLTTVSVNGAIAERIFIDTGSVGPFFLFDYFARRHPEALSQSTANRTAIFAGMGGQFDTQVVQLDSFVLGSVRFKDFTGYRVTTGASYSVSEDGLIGPDLLHFFDVHLDYPNGMIYLVPNATGLKAMH